MMKRVLGEVFGPIFTPSVAGEWEWRGRIWAKAIAGKGLDLDRYALGVGAYSNSKRVTTRHVSLIAQEAIVAANAELPVPFEAWETGRNISTIGVDLNALVGVEFWMDNVHLRGVELCEPCDRPSVLAKRRGTEKPGFKEAFKNRGGLRAEVLCDGMISWTSKIFVWQAVKAPENTIIVTRTGGGWLEHSAYGGFESIDAYSVVASNVSDDKSQLTYDRNLVSSEMFGAQAESINRAVAHLPRTSVKNVNETSIVGDSELDELRRRGVNVVVLSEE